MWVGVCGYYSIVHSQCRRLIVLYSVIQFHTQQWSFYTLYVVHIVFATVIVLRRRIEWKTTKKKWPFVVVVVAKNGGRAEKKPIAIIFTGVRMVRKKVQRKQIIDWLVPFSAPLSRGFVCSRTAQQIGMFTAETKRVRFHWYIYCLVILFGINGLDNPINWFGAPKFNLDSHGHWHS